MPRVWWVLLAAITAFGQSNPELLKILNDDRKDRENGVSMTNAQLDAIAGNDAARRKRVREMLQAGDVKTAEDYDRAAFIFRHGSEPSDYLLAHVLGMTAMAVDAGPGRWIATATLDRYLKSIGKPQIFGNDLAPKTETDCTLIRSQCGPRIACRREPNTSGFLRRSLRTHCRSQWRGSRGCSTFARKRMILS
jgi:hypothetical protein